MLIYSRNASNFCFKTEWALYELGFTFDREPNQGDHDLEGLGKVAKASPILTTVPTLVDDDGFTLTESSAIVQYLVDSRKLDTPFFPRDLKKRARILQWDRFCDFHVAKALGGFYYNSPDYVKSVKGAVLNTTEVEDAKKECPILEKKLEAVLSKQRYMTSDQDFTFADAGLAANVFFLQWFGVQMNSPSVKRWLEECTARPAFKKRMEFLK